MRSLLCAAALTVIVAGCSSQETEQSADPTTPPSTPAAPASVAPSASTEGSYPTALEGPTERDLRAAVTAYSDAFLTGDAIAAYEIFSRRCADRLTVGEFAAVVERAGQVYGKALPLQTYDAEVSGTMARVTYTYSDASINQDREPWVVEKGTWRQDDC